MRNSRVSKVRDVAESNFLSGAHAGHGCRTPLSTGRREDRSARLIEGQVANYVQLQSAGADDEN